MSIFTRRTHTDAAVKFMKAEGVTITKAAKPVTIRKGLYEVGTLGRLVSDLSYLQRTVTSETKREGDGSEQGTNLKAAIDTLCGILKDMAVEEADEVVAGLPDPDCFNDTACSSPYPY
jgi:hypothetical protein